MFCCTHSLRVALFSQTVFCSNSAPRGRSHVDVLMYSGAIMGDKQMGWFDDLIVLIKEMPTIDPGGFFPREDDLAVYVIFNDAIPGPFHTIAQRLVDQFRNHEKIRFVRYTDFEGCSTNVLESLSLYADGVILLPNASIPQGNSFWEMPVRGIHADETLDFHESMLAKFPKTTYADMGEYAHINNPVLKEDALMVLIPQTDLYGPEGVKKGVEAMIVEAVDCWDMDSRRVFWPNIKPGQPILDVRLIHDLVYLHGTLTYAELIRCIIHLFGETSWDVVKPWLRFMLGLDALRILPASQVDAPYTLVSGRGRPFFRYSPRNSKFVIHNRLQRIQSARRNAS